jgi:signal transduction histidine kinase
VSQRSELSPERVLVLTPTGLDAKMVDERLVAAGVACEVCGDADALLASFKHDAGAALLAQEALSAGQAEALLAALEGQEPWSDLPILLLTLPPSKRTARAPPAAALLEHANVMLLQRPTPVHLLVSAVRSALRARRRQYQMRDLHRKLSAVQLGDMFVSILGHDLRTPLAAIKTAAGLIVRSADDARCLRSAGRILGSTDRMTRMIEQLLDFARIRQGRGILLRLARTDLGELARHVLEEIGDANPQARIEVATSGDLSGRWDADRLHQVVSNLVGNSVQHGNPDEPITVELDGSSPKLVRLRVANLGTISAEEVPALFEPFKRTTAAQGRDQGLGLGLFIAREIVRAHGGSLALRSASGTTIFEATLPRDAHPVQTHVLTSP